MFGEKDPLLSQDNTEHGKLLKSKKLSSGTDPAEGKSDADYEVRTEAGIKCQDCILKKAPNKFRAQANMFLEGHTPCGLIFERFILLLILINIGTFILSTEPYFKTPEWKHIFHITEDVSVVIFTVEFFVRLWSIVDGNQPDSYIKKKSKGGKTKKTRVRGPHWDRWSYFFSFYCIVDFFAVFPWWIDLMTPEDLIPTTFIRILRLFRLFKAEHYVEAFTVFDNVYERNAHLLKSTGFIAMILWVMMSVLFYLSERDNPEVEGQFDNIPSAMFVTAIFFNGEWVYCDFTIWGKLIGVFMLLLGVAIFAIPIGILAEGFEAVTSERQTLRAKLAGTKLQCESCKCVMFYTDHSQNRLE